MPKEKIPTLPPTEASSAEERLEELASGCSIAAYIIPGNKDYHLNVIGKPRFYPDGFEFLHYSYIDIPGEFECVLHHNKRNIFVYYPLNINK